MNMSPSCPTDRGGRTESIERAYASCGEIVRRRARNFYYGLRLTPEPKRSALYAVYAWMRAVDDIADEPGPSAAERRASLESFRVSSRGVFAREDIGSPAGLAEWWPAFVDLVARHDLDVTPFEEMIDGQVLDLDWSACPDRPTLEHFCRLVASTVGQVCIEVWGHDDSPEIGSKAAGRGIALQLTNVIRDVREDFERGRTYLPSDELADAGLDMESLLAWRDPPRCRGFMLEQVDRARAHYAASQGLESHLHPECRATSWAMCEIYRGILERIAADPRRVVRGRVRLGSWRKAGIAWRARRIARSLDFRTEVAS